LRESFRAPLLSMPVKMPAALAWRLDYLMRPGEHNADPPADAWDLPGPTGRANETMHPEKCERLIQSNRPGVGLGIIRKVHD
jgi:hypothetical protein